MRKGTTCLSSWQAPVSPQVSERGLPYKRQEGQGNQCLKNLPVWYQNFHLEKKDRNRQKNKKDKKLQGECLTSSDLRKKWNLTLLTQGKQFDHKEATKWDRRETCLSCITTQCLGPYPGFLSVLTAKKSMNQGRRYLILLWLQDIQESQAQSWSLNNISGAVCAGAAKHTGALHGPFCCSAQDKSSSVEEMTTLAWSNGSGTRLTLGVLNNQTPHTCPYPPTPNASLPRWFFNGSTMLENAVIPPLQH